MGYYKNGKYVSSAAQKRMEKEKEGKKPVKSFADVIKKANISRIRSEAGKKGGQTRAKQFEIEREKRLIAKAKEVIKQEEKKKVENSNLDSLLDRAKKGPLPWEDDYTPGDNDNEE